MALRWRKQPNETGLRRVCQGPRGFELRDGEKAVVHVAPLTNPANRWEVIGWYWYGLGMNTSGEPVRSAEEAKAQAMAWAKERAV